MSVKNMKVMEVIDLLKQQYTRRSQCCHSNDADVPLPTLDMLEENVHEICTSAVS